MDQSTSTHGRRQKTPTVIFNSECPKVVDRFRSDCKTVILRVKPEGSKREILRPFGSE